MVGRDEWRRLEGMEGLGKGVGRRRLQRMEGGGWREWKKKVGEDGRRMLELEGREG